MLAACFQPFSVASAWNVVLSHPYFFISAEILYICITCLPFPFSSLHVHNVFLMYVYIQRGLLLFSAEKPLEYDAT